MKLYVEIGAPSLKGKECSKEVFEVFSKVSFPCLIEFENFMPRDVAFPEVDGLFLRHVASLQDTKKTLLVADLSQLQRLSASVEAIAELNAYKKAMGFSVELPDPEPESAPAEEKVEIQTEEKVEVQAEEKPAVKRTRTKKTTTQE